jgi:hypothetical protein
MRRTLALVSLLITACGGGAAPTTTQPPATTTVPPVTTTSTVTAAPVAVIRDSGGCVQMGPNCAIYVIWNDGSVAVHRSDETNTTGLPPVDSAEISGTIPVEVVDRLAAAIAATDFDELRARLGEGSCQGCVDGIDTEITFYTQSSEETISSIEFEFDPSDPLFVAVDDVRMTIALTIVLPIEQH